MIRKIVINSIEEYEAYVNDKNQRFYNFLHDERKLKSLFRGQKEDFPLFPKLCRKYEKYYVNKKFEPDSKTFKNIETELLENFKSNISSFNLYKLKKNNWFFLALGQHYGLPTRLLDWSADPLIALWFAFNEERYYDKKEKIYRIIWIMTFENNKTKYPQQQLDNFRGIEVFEAPKLDKRIINQKAWFSVQSVNYKTIEEYKNDIVPDTAPPFEPINQIFAYNDYFFEKVMITDTEQNRFDIMRKLNDKGINHHYIYPDKISELCNELENKLIK